MTMNIPNYFYRDAENREIGPLPLPALAQLRQAGVLSDSTLVRAETGAEWVECRTIIAADTTSSANTVVLPGSGSPSAPATSGNARLLGRYCWSVYAVALLCFLLPFVELSSLQRPIASLPGFLFALGGGVFQKNPISGVAISQNVPAETTATVALALACMGLLTAFIKKPESNAIGGAAGVAGVVALLLLGAKIENLNPRGQGIVGIAFKEGYWLTLVFLIGGAVIQLRDFAKAWSDGWRTNKKHGLIIGCCFAVAAIFYAAPIGYGILANSAPHKVDLGNGGVSPAAPSVSPTTKSDSSSDVPVAKSRPPSTEVSPSAPQSSSDVALCNDARVLASAVNQYFMETGVSHVEFAIDPATGAVSPPIAGYLSRPFPPGTTLVGGTIKAGCGFSLQSSKAFGGAEVAFTAEGIDLKNPPIAPPKRGRSATRAMSPDAALCADARQLALACNQYFMETGVSHVEFTIDPTTGDVPPPIGNYLSILLTPGTVLVGGSVTQGANFSLQNPQAFGGAEVVFDLTGQKTQANTVRGEENISLPTNPDPSARVARPGEYVVRRGDTENKIARSLGASISDIESTNPGIDWRSLKVGQTIKVPPKTIGVPQQALTLTATGSVDVEVREESDGQVIWRAHMEANESHSLTKRGRLFVTATEMQNIQFEVDGRRVRLPTYSGKLRVLIP